VIVASLHFREKLETSSIPEKARPGRIVDIDVPDQICIFQILADFVGISDPSVPGVALEQAVLALLAVKLDVLDGDWLTSAG